MPVDKCSNLNLSGDDPSAGSGERVRTVITGTAGQSEAAGPRVAAGEVRSNPHAEWLRKLGIALSDVLTSMERERLEHCATLIDGSADETKPSRVQDLCAELRRYFESGTLDPLSDLYLLLKEVEAMPPVEPTSKLPLRVVMDPRVPPDTVEFRGSNGQLLGSITGLAIDATPCAYPGCGALDGSQCRHWPRSAQEAKAPSCPVHGTQSNFGCAECARIALDQQQVNGTESTK